MNLDYFEKQEKKITSEFIKKGFIIFSIKEIKSLDYITNKVLKLANSCIDSKITDLNNFHKYTAIKSINNIRLKIFEKLNKDKKFKQHYYNIGKEFINILAGNELCMQRRINLSIQMPNDKTSVLPIHADVLNGDSPFEIVQWLPLVNCYKTKSMYILPANKRKNYLNLIKKYKNVGTKKIFSSIQKDLIFLNIPYGSCLIFNQNLFHGNIVNKEIETRWSFNCRYKNIFSPYDEKKLGEFFEPITLRAASRIGLDFKFPI